MKFFTFRRLPEDRDARVSRRLRQEEQKVLKDASKRKRIEREYARVEAQKKLSAWEAKHLGEDYLGDDDEEEETESDEEGYQIALDELFPYADTGDETEVGGGSADPDANQGVATHWVTGPQTSVEAGSSERRGATGQERPGGSSGGGVTYALAQDGDEILARGETPSRGAAQEVATGVPSTTKGGGALEQVDGEQGRAHSDPTMEAVPPSRAGVGAERSVPTDEVTEQVGEVLPPPPSHPPPPGAVQVDLGAGGVAAAPSTERRGLDAKRARDGEPTVGPSGPVPKCPRTRAPTPAPLSIVSKKTVRQAQPASGVTTSPSAFMVKSRARVPRTPLPSPVMPEVASHEVVVREEDTQPAGGALVSGGYLAERERAVQTAVATLFKEQREVRLCLARELADAKKREQEARTDAQSAELARVTLWKERDEERKRKEEAEAQAASLVLEVGSREEALQALKKVVDEQSQAMGGKHQVASLVATFWFLLFMLMGDILCRTPFQGRDPQGEAGEVGGELLRRVRASRHAANLGVAHP